MKNSLGTFFDHYSLVSRILCFKTFLKIEIRVGQNRNDMHFAFAMFVEQPIGTKCQKSKGVSAQDTGYHV